MTTLDPTVMKLNAANFQREVLEAAETVLVGFWSGELQPYKAFTWALKNLIEDPSVPFKAGIVNVEEDKYLAEEYGVWALPTVLIFHQGRLRHAIVRDITEEIVRRKLEGSK